MDHEFSETGKAFPDYFFNERYIFSLEGPIYLCHALLYSQKYFSVLKVAHTLTPLLCSRATGPRRL